MNGNLKWFDSKTWGLFTHYLVAPAGNDVDRMLTAQEWNERIDNFNVEEFGRHVKETGADYFCITIGQNSGHYCSPNATYDNYVGITPSKCSKRDLVMELALELEKYGIDMMVYLPAGAPCADEQAMERLEWEWSYERGIGHHDGKIKEVRLENFQRKWQEVIKEWSLRWGDKVKGWWIDGCYFPDQMYKFDNEPNFASFAAALRAGNKDAVLAFNKGLNEPFLIQSDEDDYTAGEVGYDLPVAINWDDTKEGMNEKLGGKKLQILSYLGKTWGQGDPRFPIELAVGYTKYINSKDGVITWDIPLNLDGTISEDYRKYLSELNRLVR